MNVGLVIVAQPNLKRIRLPLSLSVLLSLEWITLILTSSFYSTHSFLFNASFYSISKSYFPRQNNDKKKFLEILLQNGKKWVYLTRSF